MARENNVTTDTIEVRRSSISRVSEDYIYSRMAMVCAAVAFLGFAPTYWMPLINGRLNVHPIIHLHAAIFFGWSVFLVYQTWLGASGCIRTHRRLGLIGVALATAMTVIGIGTAINRMQWADGLGQGDVGRTIAVVPVSNVLFFALVFAAGVAVARRHDWHKRFMLVAGISILDAPISRWFIAFLAQADPPPVAVYIGPPFVALAILSIPMVVDWRRSGRVHAAYISGALGYVALKLLQVPLGETAAWQSIAAWLMRFGS
ncbi:MAG: hypothetical protein AB7L90_05620 [Hyphomicrobiaceae bacterium]